MGKLCQTSSGFPLLQAKFSKVVAQTVVSSPRSFGDATSNTVLQERIEQIAQLDQAKYMCIYIHICVYIVL